MEDRLRRAAPQHSRTPLPQVQAQRDGQKQENQQNLEVKQQQQDEKIRSRPGTARATQQAPSSGNMPPTPGTSEGEYYFVSHSDLQDGPR